jgi:hypothetical protein
VSSYLGIDIDSRLVDVTFTFDGMAPQPDFESELMASGATNFPDGLRIPRSDWDDWIREAEKYKAFPIDHSGRFTHQGNSHECVCHAATQLFECAYNRQVGLDKAVYFSPLALYTRITGGRQWGGSVVTQGFREMMNGGMLPEHDGPDWLGGKGGQSERFKATVHQTSGRSESHWSTKGWVRVSQFPSEWQNTSRHFKVKEGYYIRDAIDHFSAVVRWGVGNGRNGHAIPHVAIVKDSRGNYLSKYRDSYLVDRYDSERLWGGGYCIRSVTTPDDPMKPAGADMKN